MTQPKPPRSWWATEYATSNLAVSPAIPVHECSPDPRFKRRGSIELVPASALAAAEAEREELRAMLQKAVFVGGTENNLQAQALENQKLMLNEYSELVREACAQRDEALAALREYADEIVVTGDAWTNTWLERVRALLAKARGGGGG